MDHQNGFNERFPLLPVQAQLLRVFESRIRIDYENLVTARRLIGPLNISSLKLSLCTLSKRQDVLRTRLVREPNGAMYQVPGDKDPAVFEHALPWHGAAGVEGARELAAMHAWSRFELDGPLVRFFVVTLGPEDHVLGIVSSHIVTDVISHGLMWTQLASLYKHFEGKCSIPLESPRKFGDYVLERINWEGSMAARQDIPFWKAQMNSAPPGNKPDQTMSYHAFEVDSQKKGALAEFAKRERVTMFIVLLAIYAIVFGYRNSPKIFSKIVRDERARAEYSGLVGVFTSSCPIMFDISGNPTIRELLTRIRRAYLEIVSRPWITADQARQVLTEVPMIDYVEKDHETSLDRKSVV